MTVALHSAFLIMHRSGELTALFGRYMAGYMAYFTSADT